MTGSEYQKLAMRTNDKKSNDRLFEMSASIHQECKDFGGILNTCLGLSGEVGEFNDMIKKWVFHEKDLDIEHAKKEAGRYDLLLLGAHINRRWHITWPYAWWRCLRHRLAQRL